MNGGFVRIIGGKLKGKKLCLPPADITRPTADRAKEAVFSALDAVLLKQGKHWQDIHFLDCFSGSGAFAAEALSRGAEYVVLAEENPDALKIIKKNLDSLGAEFQPKYSVYKDALALPFAKKAFDIIFSDAPYGKGLTAKALEVLAKKGWINSRSVILTEIEKGEDLTLPKGFSITKEKHYGRAVMLFLEYDDN